MRQPIHESDVAWDTWYAGTRRELRSRALCDVGGSSKVGVGLLELAPGSTTRPAHWHSDEEEHLYVLAGRGVLHLGDQSFALRAGSYVCFPAAQAAPHYLANPHDEPLRYLIVGERIATDRVTHVGPEE